MRKLRKWVDHVACILPFEEEYFRRHGVPATFVGHPLFDELPTNRAYDPADHFPGRPPVIGLLAGSRKSEALANFRHLLDVAGQIQRAFPDASFLAPTTEATHPVLQTLSAGLPRIEIAQDQFDQMVPRCDLCLTVSGTATLHVAAHGVPMIVVYRGSPIIWHLIARWLVKTRTYSLVNLLSDFREKIVPEFIPWYGSNQPVGDLAIDYLRNPDKLAAQRHRLGQLVEALDHPGASDNVARLAMDLMQQEVVSR